MTEAMRDKKGRILKGTTLNPTGRPKGSKHKLGEDFIAALQDDFAQHGLEAIAKVREKHPHYYLKVIAQVLPKDIMTTLEVSGQVNFIAETRDFIEAWGVISQHKPILIEAKDAD